MFSHFMFYGKNKRTYNKIFDLLLQFTCIIHKILINKSIHIAPTIQCYEAHVNDCAVLRQADACDVLLTNSCTTTLDKLNTKSKVLQRSQIISIEVTGDEDFSPTNVTSNHKFGFGWMETQKIQRALARSLRS